MQKRNIYLVLSLIIIFLVIGVLSFINKSDQSSLNGMTERSSKDYQITEDIVILSNIDSLQKETMQEDSLKISKLTLFSPDFQNLESIPSKFTCDGDDVNPNLEISGVAEEAKSLILIMEDLDAPDETWDHWIKFNIPVDTRNINEGEEIQGISGEGTGGSLDYAGPCPPEGKHRYVFKLYSIDVELVLAEGSSKVEVKEAIEGHILQEAELTGVYQREEEIKIPSED